MRDAERDAERAHVQRVLELYRWEPAPIQERGSAGKRPEGNHFGESMREHLTPLTQEHRVIVESVLGKSSNGQRLDGNASERLAFKMLRFKRDPLRQDYLLVVAMNCAFTKYRNLQLAELREQAAWLNALPGGKIRILSEESHYIAYLAYAFGIEPPL